MTLAGKRILVTRGARGVGAGAGEAPGAWGAEFFPLALASPASIEDCASRLRPLDGLVNNGAIATGIGGKLMEEIDLETWDRVMTVNVRGTWLMTRACLPELKKSKGRIVNIASDTAFWGAP